MASKLEKMTLNILLDLWNTYTIICMDDCNMVL